MVSKKQARKPYMGRVPIPRPGAEHKDKKRYNRKRKHKKDWRKLYA